MKICLDSKKEKEKKFKFFSFKFFVFCFLGIVSLIFLLAYVNVKRLESDVEKKVNTEDYNQEIVYSVEEKEEKKKEVVSKIEEVVEEVPKKDVEVLEGYSKEVNLYVENLLFFVNFMDATFRLAANDFLNFEDFLLVADETADICIEYLGDKEIVPEEVLEKIEDSEKIAESYCNSAKKHSSLIRKYWDEDDGEEMVFLLKKLRDGYEGVEVKAYVLKRMSKELEGMVF